MDGVLSNSSPISALYIHIPFCHRVCPFCTFAVLKDNPARHELYLELLKQETDLLLQIYPMNFSRLESVYLGGGTPSRLSGLPLATLIRWIKNKFNIAREIEWSMEVNPEDISEDYTETISSLGISRISLGVQSFSDPCLKSLRRQHSAEQARIALSRLVRAGIRNLNIDLLFGYPGQTMHALIKDLNEAVQSEVNHISFYNLAIEPKTAFYRQSTWKNWSDEHEELIASMYENAVELLAAAGFAQYEISNFCRPGFESTQNLVYWQNRNYLGLGLGAHSHFSPYRWGNLRRLVDYKKAMNQHRCPQALFETIDCVMRGDEDLMLGLRQKKGLDLKAFIQAYPVSFSERWHRHIDQYRNQGLVEKSSSHLVLTTKGMLLADEISSSLASALFWQ